MINALLNTALQITLLLAAIWFVLALLGLKWRFFRTVRQGYSSLLKAVVVAAITWLWASEMQRQGGGQIAQAGGEFQQKEAEEWEDSEPEGLP